MALAPNLSHHSTAELAAEHCAAGRFVVALVSSAFAVAPEEICSQRRGGKTAAFARQVAMYLAHTHLGVSYSAAGSLFGRDRTTAAYACRIVEDRREDARIDSIVACLERAIDQRLRFSARNGGSG